MPDDCTDTGRRARAGRRPILVTSSDVAVERLCPRCGTTIQPVPVLYGYPTHEAFEASQRGEIRLGGCVIGDESPDYACPACDGLLPWVSPDRG